MSDELLNMSTKAKSGTSIPVHGTVGKTMGVVPVVLDRRPPPPSLWRGSSSQSPVTLKNPVRKASGKAVRKIAPTACASQNRSRSRDRVLPSPGLFGRKRDDSYDRGEEQDITFIDVPTSQCSGSPEDLYQRPKGNFHINPEQLLCQSQETDYNKVYEVNLHASDICQISNLEKFKKLRILDLSCNTIERIEKLEENQDLRELKLYDNLIKAVEKLDRLKELCNLQLQHNKIKTIGKGLSCLKKLKVLRLDSNEILRVEPGELAGCSQITTLDISSNMLDNLTALNSLPNLEDLSATNNRLRSVTDLGRCRKLKEVDLSYNRLTDVGGLKALPCLQILKLSNNQLSSLKDVGKLKNLEELTISENRFSNVASFCEQFPSLEILNVSENRVGSVEDLCVLESLSCLVELYVTGNPFTETDSTYHTELPKHLHRLDILDGVSLKKTTGRGPAPVMRPMSASSVISVRYVENQMLTLTDELQSFETSFSKRFDSLKAVFDTLPVESPSRTQSNTPGTDRPSASRCSSRSKIKLAQEFAALQELQQ